MSKLASLQISTSQQAFNTRGSENRNLVSAKNYICKIENTAKLDNPYISTLTLSIKINERHFSFVSTFNDIFFTFCKFILWIQVYYAPVPCSVWLFNFWLSLKTTNCVLQQYIFITNYLFNQWLKVSYILFYKLKHSQGGCVELLVLHSNRWFVISFSFTAKTVKLVT